MSPKALLRSVALHWERRFIGIGGKRLSSLQLCMSLYLGMTLYKSYTTSYARSPSRARAYAASHAHTVRALDTLCSNSTPHGSFNDI